MTMHALPPGRIVAAATAVCVALASGAGFAQGPSPVDVAGTETLVEVRDAQGSVVQGPVNGDAFPLWPVRSCYTWVVRLAGPPRTVEVTEIQKTPGPTRFDVTSDIKINETSDGTVWRRNVRADGGVVGTWCVNDADPPGEYLYRVLLDGRPAANFRFCGIKLAEGEEPKLEALSCKGRFFGS
jgi:hypothetical protein